MCNQNKTSFEFTVISVCKLLLSKDLAKYLNTLSPKRIDIFLNLFIYLYDFLNVKCHFKFAKLVLFYFIFISMYFYYIIQKGYLKNKLKDCNNNNDNRQQK